MKNINNSDSNNSETKSRKGLILKCIVSGSTRATNAEYLSNKATRFGVTVEEIISHYVSREVLKNLRRGQAQGLDQAKIDNILRFNGKQKKAQISVGTRTPAKKLQTA